MSGLPQLRHLSDVANDIVEQPFLSLWSRQFRNGPQGSHEGRFIIRLRRLRIQKDREQREYGKKEVEEPILKAKQMLLLCLSMAAPLNCPNPEVQGQ